MKRFLLSCTFFLFCGITFAQSGTRIMRAYVDNKQFFAPSVGNYVEFNFQFVGTSLNYKGVEGGLIGDILVETSVRNEDSIISSLAYRLSSPLMRDSIVEDFYDVQRYRLEPGEYQFNIKLTDLNSKNDPMSAVMPLKVEDLSDALSISDIGVAEMATQGDPNSVFYKSGYNIIPRLSSFYPQELSAIPVYFEVYNSELLGDSTFMLEQSLINGMTGESLEQFMQVNTYNVDDVVPVFQKINLENVPTGTYVLSYSILNSSGIPLATQQYDFERTNEIQTNLLAEDVMLDPSFQESIPEDSVLYYLEALIPISTNSEVRSLVETLKMRDNEEARKHLQQFWQVTAEFNPYEEWLAYKAQVKLVERLYGNNFQEGFETDRGRVYLQYGAPTNIISREVSPNEYPYEIWQYNKIGRFSNKRFIFYNPDLVNKSYRLLHSDMIGELKNDSWPQELTKRNTRLGGVDDPNAHVIDQWGQNAQDDFRQY
ncbi:MAG: GWxTD domain-containing protein [Fluviicola sp.]